MKFESVLFFLAVLGLGILSWPEEQPSRDAAVVGAAPVGLSPALETPSLTVADIDRALQAGPATRTASFSQ